MTQVCAVLHEQEVALSGPVHNAQRSWSARRGLLVELRAQDGWRGFGEASPLPGYSQDDLEQTRAALQRCAWGDVLAANTAREICDSVARVIPSDARAARFGAQTAALDLLGKRRGVPLWQLLCESWPGIEARPTELTALLDRADLQNAQHECEAARGRGIRSLKLKVGRCDAFARELATLRTIRERWPELRLRLDANRAWSSARANEYLAQLAPYGPEFVEEPVAAERLPDLKHVPVALALDESLHRGRDLRPLLRYKRACRLEVIVLKPTALGGFDICCELADQARSAGMDVVVSHVFEGPVGFLATATLALVLNSPGRAAGMDVHAAVADQRLPMIEGAIIVPGLVPGLGWAP